MKHSTTGYIYDQPTKDHTLSQGRNYWYAYMEEIWDEMGLRASRLTRADLSVLGSLAQLKFLFIDVHDLSAAEQQSLREWVSQGGILIGSAIKGADDLFGIQSLAVQSQPDDEYTISGYANFQMEAGAQENRLDPFYQFRGALLPIISPLSIVEVKADHAQAAAMLLNAGRMPMAKAYPAVVEGRIGQGQTWYFAFDFAQTLWVMHQGRPIDRDYDGDGYYRTGDAIPFSRLHDLSIPYGDYWLQFLEGILTQHPQPFIHQLPPFADGNVPDLLIHYGGDDECVPEYQMIASNYMKAKGLPYHINLMPIAGKFAIDSEEFKAIKNNGHDLSIHFDFVKPHFHYTEKDIQEQINLFTEAFGETPIASVNHWCTGTGWAEHARWASAHGMKGDNSRAHAFNPPYNPINLMGYGFGTVYPHFVYDDYKHGNVKIPFVNIPIGFFEPRIYEESRVEDISRIHEAIDRAAFFRWTLNMFIHPVYIADDNENKHCLPALDEVLDYLEVKRLKAIHHSTNQLCLWWIDRSQTRIDDYAVSVNANNQSVISFVAETEAVSGVIVKLPLPASVSEPIFYMLDGERKATVIQQQNGRLWALVQVPKGKHEIEIALT
ncbi:hypothetical protein [Paenibacillus nasutitermitis]|uniref:Beta-galactosidase trimerisation domain-containing protein n=1 Tax=Paenibacillus nasutitermitis TaxID=1652958 RepID=A0A917E2X5_9BACL|nr:hypothetical protein [Paenibacillus nasutitermitis]GGD98436.1 hypothetical protein GCM10010911_66540 [Paenibacillus nasutitermitis]